MVTRARSRTWGFLHCQLWKIRTMTHGNLEIQWAIAKRSLGFAEQQSVLLILKFTECSARAHRRVAMVTRARSRTRGFLHCT